MGMFSWRCQVCGRDMMSDPEETPCYKHTPAWMRDVVVFMPCGLKLEGEYTGFGCVTTGETKISPFVGERWFKRNSKELEGNSPILVETPFDNSDADRGYMGVHQWLDHYVHQPCCYHRSCWEAVGSPEGYRGPSIISTDQGFGSDGSLFQTNGFKGWEKHDAPWLPPKPERAMEWWAVNSVAHFFYLVKGWTSCMAWAEEQRQVYISIEEIEKALKESDELIKKYDKS
jgi:hypothetical protein